MPTTITPSTLVRRRAKGPSILHRFPFVGDSPDALLWAGSGVIDRLEFSDIGSIRLQFAKTDLIIQASIGVLEIVDSMLRHVARSSSNTSVPCRIEVESEFRWLENRGSKWHSMHDCGEERDAHRCVGGSLFIARGTGGRRRRVRLACDHFGATRPRQVVISARKNRHVVFLCCPIVVVQK